MRKWFCVMLAVLCLMVVLPREAQAADRVEGNLWVLEDGVLTYTGYWEEEHGYSEMHGDFRSEIAPYLDQIEEAVIKEIIGVPENAFAGAKNLRKVTFSLEHKYGVTIGTGAFAETEKLEQIIFSENVSSVTFSPDSFAGTGLREVHLSASVENINMNLGSVVRHPETETGFTYQCNVGKFAEIPTLTKFTVAEGNQYFSADDSGALYNADKTALYTVPMTTYGESYTIPDGVQYVGPAFCGNAKLTDVSIPDSVTELGGTFSGCTGLTEVELPSGLVTIGNATFQNCTGLTEMELPSGLVTIGEAAFQNCTGLTEVELPSGLVTIGSAAFWNCTGLTSIVFNEGLTSIGACAFWNCTGLTSLDFPETLVGYDQPFGFSSVLVPPIGQYAFAGCTGLTTISLPDGLRGFDAYAFQGCTGLTEITLPSSLELLGYAFNGCTGLTEIHIPERVTSAGGSSMFSAYFVGACLFDGCTSLEKITVAPGNTAFWADEQGALFTADRTTMICLPQGYAGNYVIPDGVTDITGAFYGCAGLTSLTIPDSVTSVSNMQFAGYLLNMPNAFFDGKNPTFAGCSSLKELRIPYGETALDGLDFQGCTSLERLELPDSLEAIGHVIFAECPKLTEITIPKSVIHVGYLGAVNENGDGVAPSALKKITFAGNAPEFYTTKLGDTQTSVFAGIEAEIIVPKGDPTWADILAEDLQYGGNVSWTQKELCEEHNVVDGACTRCTALFSGQLGGNLNWKLEGNKLTISGVGDMAIGVQEYSGETISIWRGWHTEHTVDAGTCQCNKIGVGGPLKLREYSAVAPWRGWAEEITEVVIEYGVTSIAERAFEDMSALKSISIANSVQKLEPYCFRGTGLTEIVLPRGLEVLEAPFGGWYIPYTEGEDYYEWVPLESVSEIDTAVQKITFTGDAPEFLSYYYVLSYPYGEDAVGVIYHRQGEVFEGTTLTAYYPSNNPTWTEDVLQDYGGKVTWVPYEGYLEEEESVSVEGSFGDFQWRIADGVLTISGSGELSCDGVFDNYKPVFSKLVIEEGITAIGYSAFSDFDNITSIRFPDSLTEISDTAFGNCTSLTTLKIPGSIKRLTGFRDCSNLTSVEIGYGVEALEETFFGCSSLQTVEIPDSVTELKWGVFRGCSSLTSIKLSENLVSIDGGAFDGCTSLKEIYLPAKLTQISGYTYSSILFYDLHALERIDVSADNPEISSDEKGVLFNKDKTILYRMPMGYQGDYVIPESVTFIELDAFNHCTGLTSVKFPATVTSISVSGCSGLTSVEIPSTVSEIHFSDCSSLTSVEIPSTASKIYFDNCSSLTSLVIPASVKEIENIMLRGCSALREVIFQGEPSPNSIEKTKGEYYPINFNLTSPTRIYYPAGSASWKEVLDIRAEKVERWNWSYAPQVYPEYCEWIPYTGCPVHSYGQWTVLEAATCTTGGKQTGACLICGETTEQETAALGHSYSGNKCTRCGAEQTSERVAGGNRFETANLVADQMKVNLGVEKFDAVVVASGTEFADALAGSYLAAVKKAPVLLSYTTDTINNGVKDYIKANLNPGGTVYILGGTNAVPENFKDGLEEQFSVKRLAGGNRFETNLLVLEEAGVGDKPILVCTGLEFADSLSASATKLPILLVYGDKLLDDQAAFLKANQGRDLYIIGGEGAVSNKLESALTAYGNIERVAGNNRFETSTLIAEKFFTAPESAVLAYAWDFPDGLCGGPLATTMNAPLVLTMEKYEAQAAAYVQANGISSAIILGGTKLLPETTVNTLFPG